MPYIRPTKRDLLKDGVNLLSGMISTPGELNYVITKLIHDCLLYDYLSSKGLNYAAINEVIGVLECTKMELYRKIAAGYEDKKQLENGPISKLDDDSHKRMR